MATRRSPRSSELRPQRVARHQLPDLDGFVVAERLAEASDPPMVVLISSREAARLRPRLEAAAALGSSRSASSRARRSPPSSAEPPCAGSAYSFGRRAPCSALPPNGSPSGWGDPRHWVRPGHRPDPIACGLVAWSRRPESRSGVSWRRPASAGSGNFATGRRAPFDWVGAHALYVYRGPLIHLLVAYPSGRLSSRPRPGRRRGRIRRRFVVTPVWRSEIATIVLAVLVVAVCALSLSSRIWSRARARLLALARCCGRGPRARRWCGRPLARRAGRRRERAVPARSRGDPLRGRRWAPRRGCSTFVGAGSCHRPSWSSSARSVGDAPGPARRALGDPSLAVGYWLPNDGEFVDSEGHRFAFPTEAPSAQDDDRGRRGADRCAHDLAVLDDPAPGGSFSHGPARGRDAPSPGRGAWPDRRAPRRRGGGSSRWATRSGGAYGGYKEGAELRLERLARAASRNPLPLRRGWRGIERIEAQLVRALEEHGSLPMGCILVVSPKRGSRAPSHRLQSRPRYRSKSWPRPRSYRPTSRWSPTSSARRRSRTSRSTFSFREVTISVTTGGRRVRIEVEDDGLGGADLPEEQACWVSRPGRGARRGSTRSRARRAGNAPRRRDPAGRRGKLTVKVNRSSSTGASPRRTGHPRSSDPPAQLEVALVLDGEGEDEDLSYSSAS